ncbi:pyridoxamine 5'-phosphate oxidase family protein [Streptomyces sp. SKN60]|uniref:pyridoxamine 5'-phosphate oxidase family protein n=1 Tax=Streptomyces sp. SKN60 TaxID=2855506 RepID=UPI0022455569|nr:pyridoxamine 5'-phosphate oxidase family protein [Streptomyces sp. SKN60]MCX2179875.1 pyridoxamine 5'-phosphate oxidase family protein [Streptomyces sp. SKN60]
MRTHLPGSTVLERTGITPVAAAFLEAQPMLVLGAADPAGRVWVSLLTGRPGFARATGPHTFSVAGGIPAHDPLGTAVTDTAGTPVGTLAVDPRTRRRLRLNGLARPSARGLRVDTERVFANCSAYVSQRRLYGTGDAGVVLGPGVGAVRRGTALSRAQQRLVRAADTFFVASATPDGADVSHRGGRPGFVTVESPTELSWPDYPGNDMFRTLGNLAADGRAGLLLLDWPTGTTLQLSGLAHTEYGPGGRTVRFRLDHTVQARTPIRWSAPVTPTPQPAAHPASDLTAKDHL